MTPPVGPKHIGGDPPPLTHIISRVKMDSPHIQTLSVIVVECQSTPISLGKVRPVSRDLMCAVRSRIQAPKPLKLPTWVTPSNTSHNVLKHHKTPPNPKKIHCSIILSVRPDMRVVMCARRCATHAPHALGHPTWGSPSNTSHNTLKHEIAPFTPI